MSSSHHFQGQNSNPNFDEQRWVIQIRQALDEDRDQESDIPVSIFTVPNPLKQISPESYVPQQVALGPYHNWRPELYDRERYKLSAAKRSRKQLHEGLKFHNLVDHLANFQTKFRACYHKSLNINGETLSWMMAVDACFLLEYLQIYAVKNGKVSSRMSHLVDTTGQKLGHNAILRDMVMLENQIPLFALTEVLLLQLASSDEADGLLYALLMGFCKEMLPFEMTQGLPNVHEATKCAHLLDLLYHLMVPKVEGSASEITSPEAEGEDMNEGEKTEFRKVIRKSGAGLVSLIKRLMASRPVKALLTLPWKILSNLPGVVMMKQIDYLCFAKEKGKAEPEDQGSDFKNSVDKPPLMEEIAIPSVTELSRAGVRFSVTDSGIAGISFDGKMAAFHLPRVRLDVNTEVAMRNLVAYEACSASGPLILARYVELMNGIIDTAEDAKLLREQGIVLNHLKSDEEVASLWNGMSKSVRLTKVPFLDKVIEDVNGYYSGSWRVRIGKFLRRRGFGSRQPMTMVAAVLVLFFLSLQAFCSVFGCVPVRR